MAWLARFDPSQATSLSATLAVGVPSIPMRLSFWINSVMWSVLLLLFLVVVSSSYFWSSIDYP